MNLLLFVILIQLQVQMLLNQGKEDFWRLSPIGEKTFVAHVLVNGHCSPRVMHGDLSTWGPSSAVMGMPSHRARPIFRLATWRRCLGKLWEIPFHQRKLGGRRPARELPNWEQGTNMWWLDWPLIVCLRLLISWQRLVTSLSLDRNTFVGNLCLIEDILFRDRPNFVFGTETADLPVLAQLRFRYFRF